MNKSKLYLLIGVPIVLLVVLKVFLHRAKSKQEALDRAIVQAAKTGQFAELPELLLQGASPNGRHFDEPDGSRKFPYHPPISYACEAGNVDAVNLLLDAGVNIKKDGLEGNLLLAAIENEDKQLFTLLLNRNADPNATPHERVDMNVLGLVVDYSWRREWDTEKTLEYAELALKYGADVNQHGMHGFTPLTQAVGEQMPEVVKLFLDNDGVIEEADTSGKDSMDTAASRSNSEIIDLLVQYGGKYTIQEAVCIGREDDVVEFLKADPSVVKDSYIFGRSLLGLALKRGEAKIAKHLIDAGADFRKLDEEGNSLLHLAALGGNSEMVKLLIDRGLNVNGRNNSQNTPLHETTFSDRAAAAKVLIDAGADVNARASSKITPTGWASAYDSPNVLKLLLAAGCDPNESGAYDGALPLGSACHYSDNNSVPGSVKVLLSSGAKVNKIGSKGRPAIHWAAGWFGGVRLVQYLLDHGANPLIVDSNGETALDIARRNKKIGVLNLLEGWAQQNPRQ